MKHSIKTVITATLLSTLLVSLQFCKKNDLPNNQKAKIAGVIKELSSKPQLVFKRIVHTDEEIKQMIASSRNESGKTLGGCPGDLYSVVSGYYLTYAGGYNGNCTGADYKITINYVLWSSVQTDDGYPTYANPDPSLSGVTLTINSQTLYPETVVYNAANDRKWICTFSFRYSDVGLSLTASSISTTIFGTFTCSSSDTDDVNDGHNLTIDACDSFGIVFPDISGSAGAGNCWIYFPWDLTCYPALVPNAGYEIKYRPQGSSGSYTTISSSTTTFGPVTASGSAGTYEYLSRYKCSGSNGYWWEGTFVIQ